MRDKHIHIAEDSALLKLLYKKVEGSIVPDKAKFTRQLLVKFIFYFGAMIAGYRAIVVTKSTSLFLLAFVFYGFAVLLFAFNFSHDFSHNTIFRNKKLNHFCFVLIYAIIGAHGEAWKQRHIQSHHYAPNVQDYDSDLNITTLIRVIPGSKYYWFHRFQHWYAPFAYMTYSLYWIFIKDIVILYSKDDFVKGKNFGYHFSFWIQKIFYVVLILVIPILYSQQEWYFVLVGFLLMHLLQSIFLLFTFFMTHHVESTAYPSTDKNGYINASWLMNQVKSSNDMHPFSKTANFILGGFNNHIAHHLFPQYHHVYYPELNKILYKTLRDHKIIPNQTSYWGGIVSHLRLLKRMSRPEAA
ncbi:fatty acid desaturase family protein [Pollutibacter soli]|uniref:fatty acid desaturase family protein n=1 Tax=Pollutibacter soli TaxID=3034157 RepID=UPI003013680A